VTVPGGSAPPADLTPVVRALEGRVAFLEAQLAFLDLLLVPRIRAAAVAAAAHVVIRADQLPPATSGFYGSERTPAGLAFCWTEYDQGGRLLVPLVAGMRYMGLLNLLSSPHVHGPADVVLLVEGRRVPLTEVTGGPFLALHFEHVASTTGMAEILVNAAALLVPEHSIPDSTDNRRLGVQMCGLELMCAGYGPSEPPAAAADPPEAVTAAGPTEAPPAADVASAG
jgi:hypothetical protein